MDIASRQVEVHRSVITRGRATPRTCRAVILVALATLASAGPAFAGMQPVKEKNKPKKDE